MSDIDLNTIQADKVIDARGSACPGPLLAAKKEIANITAGQVMEVLSADEGTKRDIPKWASKKGHDYLGVVEEDGYFRIYLKKG